MKSPQELKDPAEILEDMIRLREAYQEAISSLDRMIEAGRSLGAKKFPSMLARLNRGHVIETMKRFLSAQAMRKGALMEKLQAEGYKSVTMADIDQILASHEGFGSEARGWWRYVAPKAEGKEGP